MAYKNLMRGGKQKYIIIFISLAVIIFIFLMFFPKEEQQLTEESGVSYIGDITEIKEVPKKYGPGSVQYSSEIRLMCESLKAEGDETKCIEIYNSPKFSHLSEKLNIDKEIKDCVIESKLRKTILNGDPAKCENLKEDKYFGSEDTAKISTCKLALVSTERECESGFNDTVDIDDCKVLYKYKKDISYKDSLSSKNKKEQNEFHIFRAMASQDIASCQFIDKGKDSWHLYKMCIYELKHGNVEEDFCDDSPA